MLWQQEHGNERFETSFSSCEIAVANTKLCFKLMKALAALVVLGPVRCSHGVVWYHQRIWSDSQLVLLYLLTIFGSEVVNVLVCVTFFTITNYCDDSPGCLLMNLGRILVLCDSCWLKIRCFWSYLCIACMYVKACMESLLFHTMGLADALYKCFLFFFFLPLPYLMLAFVLINLLKLPFTWALYLLWMFMSHRILGCYREDCTGRCQVLLETCTFYYAAFFL